MRNAECGTRNREATRRAGLAVALALLIPAGTFAQEVSVAVQTDLPGKSLGLSESVRATVTVEGPAPLRVELPKPLLAPETDRDWKIQPVGPAMLTPSGENREKWSQTFRLDPYVPGEMYVLFAPLKVNGREVAGPGFAVNVIKTVAETKAEAARPVTGIEELPPLGDPDGASLPPWAWVAIMVGVGLGAMLGAVVWRLRRRAPPVPPREWALAAFDRLERSSLARPVLVERAAAILREFIDRRFGIPAPRLTTPELLAAGEKAEWQADVTANLAAVLEQCDRAKFAADVPDEAACRELLAQCRAWVRRAAPTNDETW
jgi:hypothetical protein